MKHPAGGSRKFQVTTEGIKLETIRAEFVLIQSCGYACFWGLFGCLAGVWRVFEVAAKVANFASSNGVVALAGLYRDKTQVSSLIRNKKMLDLRL